MPSSFSRCRPTSFGPRRLSTQFVRTWEFGRRDRIPSAGDPRTKLIDQAMVGHGLIKPEELVRIHESASRWTNWPDRVRARPAQRAVVADREERKRIKAEKKAAAEQRKREHAARVAANKQNDIIHLGRGVSAGLADRRSNVEKLQQHRLPVLASPADVATALGIPIPRLRWLAYHAEASTVSHYVRFVVPKKSGGERHAHRTAPADGRRSAVDLREFLRPLPAHNAAHGFVKDRSILTNARPHVGAAVVINCDLVDFFPSITVHRVIGLFRQIGYSPAAATILALIVTESPPQKVLYNGKPWYVATGPRVAAGGMYQPGDFKPHRPAAGLPAERHREKIGWTYTRYADDLTFSSAQSKDRIGYLLARSATSPATKAFP